ncbi:metal-dependent transcriptional regulator [Desulfovulcanus sp.]
MVLTKGVEKELTSSMEDYLEVIFELDEVKKVVRVKDIANRLGVKMPSVTSMLKALSDRGLVNYEKYGYVTLTGKGAEVGKEVHQRHKVLLRFLVEFLKVDFETANEDACKMEHILSDVTLNSLIAFMQFIQNCPRTGENWLRYFEGYKKRGRPIENCVECREQFSFKFQKMINDLKKKMPKV